MKREELKAMMIDIMRKEVEEAIEELLEDISYDNIESFIDNNCAAQEKIKCVAEESVEGILDEILEDINEYDIG